MSCQAGKLNLFVKEKNADNNNNTINVINSRNANKVEKDNFNLQIHNALTCKF